MSHACEVTFVFGGIRSGKSRFGLAHARATGGDRVTFVATARRGDPELDTRIEAHRRVRPAAWHTLECDTDLARTITLVDPDHVLLVDSLTLWVAACLDTGTDVRAGWDAADAAIAARKAPCVLVSDEIGHGIVPANELARRFVDELGILHQRITADADRVVLLVAGIPIALKGSL